MNNKKLSKGFTIIELVIVMAIFLFIIGAAISIFLNVLQNQKRILADQELLNQISYVEEYMSKALRMAKIDTTGDCLGVDNKGYIFLLTRQDTGLDVYRGIKFINQSDGDACQEFFLDNVTPDNISNLTLDDPNNPVVLKELKNNTDVSKATFLTSANLKISSIRFGINGSDGSISNNPNPDSAPGASGGDLIQPKVTILLKVSPNMPGDDNEPSTIIQTTISQRNLNVR